MDGRHAVKLDIGSLLAKEMQRALGQRRKNELDIDILVDIVCLCPGPKIIQAYDLQFRLARPIQQTGTTYKAGTRR